MDTTVAENMDQSPEEPDKENADFLLGVVEYLLETTDDEGPYRASVLRAKAWLEDLRNAVYPRTTPEY